MGLKRSLIFLRRILSDDVRSSFSTVSGSLTIANAQIREPEIEGVELEEHEREATNLEPARRWRLAHPTGELSRFVPSFPWLATGLRLA